MIGRRPLVESLVIFQLLGIYREIFYATITGSFNTGKLWQAQHTYNFLSLSPPFSLTEHLFLMESDVRTRLAFHKFAIDVAYRLSSLRDFLAASERLLQLDDPLSDSVFERHGRKAGPDVGTERSRLKLQTF